MVGFGLFSELQNPSNVTLPNLGCSASRSPQVLTSNATALRAVRRHVFFVAGTVSVPPLDLSGGAESALTAAHKNALIAVRNEAAATNDAVLRARR